jgi:hypothetical protein
MALLGGLSLGSKGEAPSTPHAGLAQLMRSGLVTTPALAQRSGRWASRGLKPLLST